MNFMKKHNFISILIPLFIAFSFVGGQTIIANKKPINLPRQSGQFEQTILNQNRFQMNQGFTFMTSMGGGMSQTTGIYSNFSSYKLSERLKLNTSFHLIQNQNNLSYSNGPQTGLGYEFGLEYQMGPNSILSLQVVNLSNSPIRYRNLSPFNVP